MVAFKGRNILIKASDNTSPGSFLSIGGLRNKGTTINNELVDVTDSDNAPWRALLEDAGLRTLSISGQGVFKDDTAARRVKLDAAQGAKRDYQIVFPNGDMITGSFMVSSFERSGNYNEAETYSMTLENAGEPVFTYAA